MQIAFGSVRRKSRMTRRTQGRGRCFGVFLRISQEISLMVVEVFAFIEMRHDQESGIGIPSYRDGGRELEFLPIF